MSFNREDCEYTKFNIENRKMEFSADEDGILMVLVSNWVGIPLSPFNGT